MSAVAVRPAIAADLDTLAGLFDEYRQFQGQRADLAAARAFLQARAERGESVVFLAHDGPQALGFAQLYPSFSSVAMARVFILNDLFVHAAARRRGVASALLAAVEAHAWSQGAARITLNVGRENREGQALYEARGWRPDGQYFMYHRFAGGG
jgi:GNAT superfamily N-acetyltransferase